MKRGLSGFTACIDIGFDFGYADIDLRAACAFYEQGRRLLDVVFAYKVHSFLGEHLGIADPCLVEHRGCDLAVRAGLRRHKRNDGYGCALVLQSGMTDVIELAVLEFLGLAVVPVLNGTVVAGDAAVDLSRLAADGAGILLAGQVAVLGADGIGRGEGIAITTITTVMSL